MSRLRRLVLSDRLFFVTCNLHRSRSGLDEQDFDILARVIQARRSEHAFLLSAWVFLPDHWHAIVAPQYPETVSRVMEAIKVSSTRQINARKGSSGSLWQGRFFDRALRTVREYNETVEYIHTNPVRRGLVARAEEWRWSSAHEHGFEGADQMRRRITLRIDRMRIPADPRARL